MKKRSVDLNGIGQVKVKTVKRLINEEPVIKRKIEKKIKNFNKNIPIKKQKIIKEPRTVKKQKTVYNDISLRKNLIDTLIPEIKNEYNLSSYNIYYAGEGDIPCKIHGDDLENEIVIERCLSYINPVVIVNPNGITDNRAYKSRYITRLYTENGMYLICVSSYSIEAFRNNAGEKITKKIYELLNPFNESTWGND